MGGGGGAAIFFPCSADHERDWPPCNKVVFRDGNQYAFNVRNNYLIVHYIVFNYLVSLHGDQYKCAV